MPEMQVGLLERRKEEGIVSASTDRELQQRYAEIGRFVYQRYRRAACRTARIAVKSGRVKAASEHKCADCDKRAEVYDHRNYDLPSLIVPVCHGCNMRRGMALLSLQRIDTDLGPYWGDGDDGWRLLVHGKTPSD